MSNDLPKATHRANHTWLLTQACLTLGSAHVQCHGLPGLAACLPDVFVSGSRPGAVVSGGWPEPSVLSPASHHGLP